MIRYKQLTSEQRYAIFIGLQEGKSKRSIAQSIGVSPSTVCREITRNKTKHGKYSRRIAHEMAMERKERVPGNKTTAEWIKRIFIIWWSHSCGRSGKIEENFTCFVFKIHANMDPNHRSCIAFVKVCSGKFECNVNYLHVRFNRMMKFSAPTAFMAQKKEVLDEAYAGDIVGLPDNGGTFKIGDMLTSGEELHFKGLPGFSPEMFKYIENADPMKSKQLNKGIEQLMDEGVAQLFTHQFNGRRIIGTVGQLQFEVIQYRLLHEYNAQCRWEPINLYKACRIESDDRDQLKISNVENINTWLTTSRIGMSFWPNRAIS